MSGADLSALRARLARLTAAAERCAAEAVRAAAEQAAAQARAACPVGDGRDGGHLRDCIRAEMAMEGDCAVGRVVAENPHAAYVELGTGRRGGGSSDWPGMAARPYLRPSVEVGRAALIAAAGRALGGDGR